MRCHQFRLPSFFIPLLLVSVLGAPAHAGDSPTDEPKNETIIRLRLQGKLAARTLTRGGEKVRVYSLRIGATDYELSGAENSEATFRKAKGKYVTLGVDGGATGGEDPRGITLAGTVTCALQERTPLAGTVRIVAEGKKRRTILETEAGAWRIAAKDARRFKPFIDRHVEATCFRVTDGRFRALEGVKAVARKLLPGEREPTSGEEAIGAAWKGVLTATKVPKGIPGIKPGDFAIAFVADAALTKTEGRLTNTYDVVGLRLRKYKHSKRRAQVELAYSFGQGSYAITLDGTFSPEWKTFAGTWKSGFLGSGTFRLVYQPKKTSGVTKGK